MKTAKTKYLLEKLTTTIRKCLNEAQRLEDGTIHLRSNPDDELEIQKEICNFIADNPPYARGYYFMARGRHFSYVIFPSKNEIGYFNLIISRRNPKWTIVDKGMAFWHEDPYTTWYKINGQIYKTDK